MSEFHKKVRYRRLRTMLSEVDKRINLSLHQYDTENIVAYKACENIFAGRCINVRHGYTCFLRNNMAEIYEIPKFSNSTIKNKMLGDFLLIYGDSKYVDYSICKMHVEFNENTGKYNADYEYIVTFYPFPNGKSYNIQYPNFRGCFDYTFTRDFDKGKKRESIYVKKYGVMKTIRANSNKQYIRVASRKTVKIYKKRKQTKTKKV